MGDGPWLSPEYVAVIQGLANLPTWRTRSPALPASAQKQISQCWSHPDEALPGLGAEQDAIRSAPGAVAAHPRRLDKTRAIRQGYDVAVPRRFRPAAHPNYFGRERGRPMTPGRIFISSVQREFAREREQLRDYLRGDPPCGASSSSPNESASRRMGSSTICAN